MRRCDRTAAGTLTIVLLASPAYAQRSFLSSTTFETAAAFDRTVDEDGNLTTGVTADALATTAVSENVQLMFRPFVQRLGNGEWNAQVWVAGLRYERPGPVGLRIDAGLIPSPIGLANLTLRPHLNPTIGQPSSLFTTLPSTMLRMPRTTLLGPVYPLGVSATVSSLRWDVRAAAIDTSPVRTRRVFSDNSPPNPPRFGNLIVGGGVTPFIGFRVGASVAHGEWLKEGEGALILGDRNATVFTVESEFSYRHTRLLGEWVRDRFEAGNAVHIAYGYYLQGQQTLSPRWFVAGRVERMSAPAASAADQIVRQHFTGVEETIGYRLLPEITLRLSHRAREGFGSRGYAHTASVSVVFWKRFL